MDRKLSPLEEDYVETMLDAFDYALSTGKDAVFEVQTKDGRLLKVVVHNCGGLSFHEGTH